MINHPDNQQHSIWLRRAAKAFRLVTQCFNKIIYSAGKYYRKYQTQHILLYTDSRGINIHGHYQYKHYSTRLCNAFYVDAYIAPEKWTTIPDFLDLYQKISNRKYDFIILHAGIVDASPRHQKTIQNIIYPQKKRSLDALFGENEIQAYYNSDLGCDYENDKTINLYSLDMAREKLIPLLKNIPNLIWISHNPIVPGWQGNYWKPRPDNISIIEDYSHLFIDEFTGKVDIVNLMKWSTAQVKQFTFDNIHPNREGSDYIYHQIIGIINQSIHK